jgi:hypothetical protein
MTYFIFSYDIKGSEIEELLFDKDGLPSVICFPTPYTLPGVVCVIFSLSILGCIFVLLTYSLFSELRTLTGLLLINLCAAILLQTIAHLIVRILLSIQITNQTIWLAFYISRYHFISCKLVWMTLLLFQMTRHLYLGWRVRKPSQTNRKCRHLLVYMLIGWGLPFLLFTSAYLLAPLLGDSRILLWAVCMLWGVSLLVSIAVMTVVTILLCLLSRNRKKTGHTYYRDLIRLWVAFSAVIFPSLTLLSEVHVIISLLALGRFIPLRKAWISHIILLISNTQIFIISLAFLFTKKIFKLYKDLFMSRCQKHISCPCHWSKESLN